MRSAFKIKILIFLIFLTGFSPEKKTEIYIVGTVHNETQIFNSDTLLNILNKINPDLILIECDTSYLTSGFILKDEIKNSFLETMAITKYLSASNTQIRPYDVNGRDLFLDDSIRKKNETEFFEKLDILYRMDEFNPAAKETSEKIISMMKLADEMSNSSAYFINSSEGKMNTDTINHYTYRGIEKLIENEPQLYEYKSYWINESDFWNKRNKIMLENILKYKNNFEGKKIVVLCGFAHKNFLKRELLEKSEENNIIVKDFYE